MSTLALLTVLVAANLGLTVVVVTVLGGILKNVRRVAAPSGTAGASAVEVAQSLVSVPAVADPLDLRPDPTARYNVFRVDANGRLMLADVQRYTGTDAALAEQAVETYRASEWRGRVYAFEHTQLREVLD